MDPQNRLARRQKLTPELRKMLFVTPLNNDSWAYRNLAMELIFLCRFFVQAHERNLNSSIQLRT